MEDGERKDQWFIQRGRGPRRRESCDEESVCGASFGQQPSIGASLPRADEESANVSSTFAGMRILVPGPPSWRDEIWPPRIRRRTVLVERAATLANSTTEKNFRDKSDIMPSASFNRSPMPQRHRREEELRFGAGCRALRRGWSSQGARMRLSKVDAAAKAQRSAMCRFSQPGPRRLAMIRRSPRIVGSLTFRCSANASLRRPR